MLDFPAVMLDLAHLDVNGAEPYYLLASSVTLLYFVISTEP